MYLYLRLVKTEGIKTQKNGGSQRNYEKWLEGIKKKYTPNELYKVYFNEKDFIVKE